MLPYDHISPKFFERHYTYHFSWASGLPAKFWMFGLGRGPHCHISLDQLTSYLAYTANATQWSNLLIGCFHFLLLTFLSKFHIAFMLFYLIGTISNSNKMKSTRGKEMCSVDFSICKIFGSSSSTMYFIVLLSSLFFFPQVIKFFDNNFKIGLKIYFSTAQYRRFIKKLNFALNSKIFEMGVTKFAERLESEYCSSWQRAEVMWLLCKSMPAQFLFGESCRVWHPCQCSPPPPLIIDPSNPFGLY